MMKSIRCIVPQAGSGGIALRLAGERQFNPGSQLLSFLFFGGGINRHGQALHDGDCEVSLALSALSYPIRSVRCRSA